MSFEILLVLAGCITIAYSIEAATGFGSIVIAVAIGVFFVPADQLLAILVPLNLLMTLPLAIRNYRHIQWRTLMLSILPFMGAGTLVGMLGFDPNAQLAQQRFGLLIIWFGGRSLWLLLKKPQEQKQRTPLLTKITLFASGITHGMFASGGPLLVYALAGTRLSKSEFRATLLVVWVVLNCVLMVNYWLSGILMTVTRELGMLTPFVILGAVSGNWLHRRIQEEHFLIVVFALLIVVGALLFVS